MQITRSHIEKSIHKHSLTLQSINKSTASLNKSHLGFNKSTIKLYFDQLKLSESVQPHNDPIDYSNLDTRTTPVIVSESVQPHNDPIDYSNLDTRTTPVIVQKVDPSYLPGGENYIDDIMSMIYIDETYLTSLKQQTDPTLEFPSYLIAARDWCVTSIPQSHGREIFAYSQQTGERYHFSPTSIQTLIPTPSKDSGRDELVGTTVDYPDGYAVILSHDKKIKVITPADLKDGSFFGPEMEKLLPQHKSPNGKEANEVHMNLKFNDGMFVDASYLGDIKETRSGKLVPRDGKIIKFIGNYNGDPETKDPSIDPNDYHSPEFLVQYRIVDPTQNGTAICRSCTGNIYNYTTEEFFHNPHLITDHKIYDIS